MKPLLITMFLTVLLFDTYSQFPPKPNLTDENNNKQGEWIYYFTNEWERTEKYSEASYYRLITYIDSKPTGIVRDYYLDGQIQMQFDSLISEDPEQYQGTVLAFSKEGYVNQINCYNQGKLDTAKTIRTFQQYIEQYRLEIPDHVDLAYLANDLAYIFREQKKYSLAEPYYQLAKNIREKQLGQNHIQYGISCYKLAFVLQKQAKSEQALPLFEEASRVFLDIKGKEDENYLQALRYIDEIKAGNKH